MIENTCAWRSIKTTLVTLIFSSHFDSNSSDSYQHLKICFFYVFIIGNYRIGSLSDLKLMSSQEKLGGRKNDPYISRGMREVLKRKNENENQNQKRYEYRTGNSSDEKEYQEMRDGGGYEESKGENAFKSRKINKSHSV